MESKDLSEALPEASRRCREAGVRLYLTVNTIVFADELPKVEELLAFAKEEEFELSDEQLESVVGGVSGGWAPEGYDPSGMWKDLPTSGTN